jgi:hypothetical protein
MRTRRWNGAAWYSASCPGQLHPNVVVDCRDAGDRVGGDLATLVERRTPDEAGSQEDRGRGIGVSTDTRRATAQSESLLIGHVPCQVWRPGAARVSDPFAITFRHDPRAPRVTSERPRLKTKRSLALCNGLYGRLRDPGLVRPRGIRRRRTGPRGRRATGISPRTPVADKRSASVRHSRSGVARAARRDCQHVRRAVVDAGVALPRYEAEFDGFPASTRKRSKRWEEQLVLWSSATSLWPS